MADFVRVTGGNFQPSTAKTGDDNLGSVLRGKNMMLRGSGNSFYFESYGGETNLNEPIPMKHVTGTVSYTENSANIVGVGTRFKSELRYGMKVLTGDQVFVVDSIETDLLFTAQRVADATASSQEAYKMPILFGIDNKRGTLIWGNAVKSDKGNITAVGEGILRINGDVLAGDSLTASRKLKIALYQPSTNNFRVEDMGFTLSPSGVMVKVVTGGIKNMSIGQYSFLFCWANFDTAFGFSNPSDVVKFDIYNNPISITGTLQRFEIDFTTALATKPSNADSIVIFRSEYAGSTANLLQASEGPWYLAAQVKIADLETGDKYFLDILDGELDNLEITFDNDPPPDADWLAFLRGDAILVSCYGEKTTTNDDGTAPGPMISAQKRSNRDAFPADYAVSTSPPETIIGFVPGQDRIYLLTKVSLPIAVPTQNELEPVTTQPFWHTGFHSPFGLVLVNNDLYAFTSKGITRSIAIGDVGSEQYFAENVAETTRNWTAGYVHAVHDRQNEVVLFIHSAFKRNENGYWVSVALPLYLNLQTFGPLIEIARDDRDMIVCGAANIGGKLQFLAGGRLPTVPTEFSVSEGLSATWNELAGADFYEIIVEIV